MRIDSSGNVSIGTTGTNRKLTVTGSSTTQGTIYAYTNEIHTGTDTAAHVSIRSDHASASGDVLHVRGDGSGNLLTIDKSGTEKLVVASSGNVGIGTSSPSAKLHVATSGAEGINIGLQNSERYWNMETDGGFLQIKDVSAGSLARMTFDTSGRVGINRTPAISNTKLEIGGADDVQLIALEASGYTAGLGVGATGLQFFTDSTVRSKIDITGEFLINRANGFGTAGACALFVTGRSASAINVTSPNTSGYPFLNFFNGGLNEIGSIKNSNNNATVYNTTSDYRLKENVDYTWDATTRLKQLKPARFNWIKDESNTLIDGFLAHEVSSIVPEAITGDKDATETYTNCVVNSEGNLVKNEITQEEWTAGKEDGTFDADTTWVASHTQNVYQGIDHSKLVPLLTKALQEQQTIIEDLQARIETLEG
jgi:hypothetical protein